MSVLERATGVPATAFIEVSTCENRSLSRSGMVKEGAYCRCRLQALEQATKTDIQFNGETYHLRDSECFSDVRYFGVPTNFRTETELVMTRDYKTPTKRALISIRALINLLLPRIQTERQTAPRGMQMQT
jgi:hypothetical protein